MVVLFFFFLVAVGRLSRIITAISRGGSLVFRRRQHLGTRINVAPNKRANKELRILLLDMLLYSSVYSNIEDTPSAV